MPHLLRLPRDLEERLEGLCRQTGLGKAELIERCLAEGLTGLEAQLLLEGAHPPRVERTIDQLLRESGLGA
ncbi:putative DNA-binding protein [Halomonas campaniensis]|uniref:Putative DNA-binding protein n=1 Tax=Halomonas campaniensis TaxID=213554 RepID=A0A7W5K2T9_9GAMM|nr:ribbon-helix-helix protein, CopG family [Halomonas campaniensis]MBB3330894.1 putative DNA-binding protein [Halomonas campaniensis]